MISRIYNWTKKEELISLQKVKVEKYVMAGSSSLLQSHVLPFLFVVVPLRVVPG